MTKFVFFVAVSLYLTSAFAKDMPANAAFNLHEISGIYQLETNASSKDYPCPISSYNRIAIKYDFGEVPLNAEVRRWQPNIADWSAINVFRIEGIDTGPNTIQSSPSFRPLTCAISAMSLGDPTYRDCIKFWMKDSYFNGRETRSFGDRSIVAVQVVRAGSGQWITVQRVALKDRSLQYTLHENIGSPGEALYSCMYKRVN